MKLTQQQGALVTNYLRDVASALDEKLSSEAREEALARLRADLYRALEGTGRDRISDAEVEAALGRFGPPKEQALALSGQGFDTRVLLPEGDRIWLGVCAGIAARLGVEPWVLRVIGAVLCLAGPVLSLLTIASVRDWSSVTIGLFTISLALVTYLLLFAYLRIVSGPRALPPVRIFPILVNSAVTLIIAVALHLGVAYLLDLLRYAHETFLKRPFPMIGSWGWIEQQAGGMLFWALACCLPLAVLGSLPLANGWDQSLKKAGHAGLALYGVALAFGVASYLAGGTLDLVENFEALRAIMP
ncbi:MAG TPA: PspC domain-containing protein [Candidatus Hydrogenedentes bacterium]|nr:PspC domain-containing protein [Candidatus Hydrogenedentota bacterium]HNT86308.1 PspC domain-containing protein [Candidatus Hydrogenedentota bacterium]